MASGDLPKDFPTKEANLLGPMIHLLLDKVEEMVRKSELPPQYPNNQDKYDKDMWSLVPNKPDYIKTGIEVMTQRDSNVTAVSKITSDQAATSKEVPKQISTITQQTVPVTAAETAVSMKIEPSPKEPTTISNDKDKSNASEMKPEDATQDEKSSPNVPKETLIDVDDKQKATKNEHMKEKDQCLKESQLHTTEMPHKKVKNKLKAYHAVPSQSRKLRKSSSKMTKKDGTVNLMRHTKDKPAKQFKKRSTTKPSKQIRSTPPQMKPTVKLNDYFYGIDPNNALYRSIFKIPRLKRMVRTRETREKQVDHSCEKSSKAFGIPIERTDQSPIKMVDMRTEASIPSCPVHQPSCDNTLQQFDLPFNCEQKTFQYEIKAWKDDHEILLPAKVSVRRLTEKEGLDIRFAVDTRLIPGVKPFVLHAYCPGYDPRRAWINGKLCLYE